MEVLLGIWIVFTVIWLVVGGVWTFFEYSTWDTEEAIIPARITLLAPLWPLILPLGALYLVAAMILLAFRVDLFQKTEDLVDLLTSDKD